MHSEKVDQIAAALTKVQRNLQPASKDATNPFFKSKYASLASVWENCRQLLALNDLAISQIMETVDGKPHLNTLLIHSSGQWLKSQMPITPKKQDPQSFGSALTYARRYGLSAIVGIVADDDDDGNQASEIAKPAQASPAQAPPPQPQPANGNGTRTPKVEFVNRLVAELGATPIEIGEILRRGYREFDPAQFDEQYKFVVDHFAKDEIPF